MDIILNLNEAKSILKFNLNNVNDQGVPPVETKIIKYKDFQQYFVLYSYASQHFKIPIEYDLVFKRYEESLKEQKPEDFRHDMMRIHRVDEGQNVKHSWGCFDQAHYILISSMMDLKLTSKEVEKHNESRLRLLKSLTLERQYRDMNRWSMIKTCF